MTITIPLTRGYVAIVDDEDADLLRFKWTAHVRANGVYAKRAALIDGREVTIYMHRVIVERIVGRPLLSTERADHREQPCSDNTRGNVRLATHQQNMMNRRLNANNRSGFKGVRWVSDHNAWAARITFNGESIFLGYHETPEAAHTRYCEEAVLLYGEFANDGTRPLRLADAPVATRQLPLFDMEAA